MQTFTVDIINKDAIKLLQDLEMMQLISLRKEKNDSEIINWSLKYKGAMSKQNMVEVDTQINELRNSWE